MKESIRCVATLSGSEESKELDKALKKILNLADLTDEIGQDEASVYQDDLRGTWEVSFLYRFKDESKRDSQLSKFIKDLQKAKDKGLVTSAKLYKHACYHDEDKPCTEEQIQEV